MFTNNPSSIRDGTDRQTNCETNYWFIISTAAGSALILFLSLVPCQTRGYEYRTATTGQKSTESLISLKKIESILDGPNFRTALVRGSPKQASFVLESLLLK